MGERGRRKTHEGKLVQLSAMGERGRRKTHEEGIRWWGKTKQLYHPHTHTHTHTHTSHSKA